ncbi:uncharacterized protein LOC142597794 [Dermatophagoides farinae]|uniref:uncharacterized protein LOC142597794 n=1 Tax=Dermatophagoides farinae TaxID=6954 RepID=UPI003F6045EF
MYQPTNNHINGEINNHIAQEEEQRRFDHWAARYVAHIIYWFQNLIRRSTSDYSFPVVLVNKKDDGEKSRLCVDFRKLNTITIPERYRMPNIKDIEDRLLGAKIFATLDISSGFHHIPVAEEDKRKTAFVTMHEHFEWNVMPFGLKNAPAIFQRIVYNILKRNGRQNSPKIGIQVIQNSSIFVYKRQNRIADMAPLDFPVEHNLADDGEINNHNNGEINNHINGEINNHINGEIHNHINGEINIHLVQEEQRRFDHWTAHYVSHIIYWFQHVRIKQIKWVNGPVSVINQLEICGNAVQKLEFFFRLIEIYPEWLNNPPNIFPLYEVARKTVFKICSPSSIYDYSLFRSEVEKFVEMMKINEIKRAKAHFISHYPSLVGFYGGSLVSYSSRRFERKNKEVKSLILHSRNFKDVAYSLSWLHQAKRITVKKTAPESWPLNRNIVRAIVQGESEEAISIIKAKELKTVDDKPLLFSIRKCVILQQNRFEINGRKYDVKRKIKSCLKK